MYSVIQVYYLSQQHLTAKKMKVKKMHNPTMHVRLQIHYVYVYARTHAHYHTTHTHELFTAFFNDSYSR